MAKSTHSGLPWFLYLHRQLGETVHFWPFDGWDIPASRSAIVEAYPSMWRHAFSAREGMTSDQHDAYAVAKWLRRADREGQLQAALHPRLSPAEQAIAEVEG